MKYEKLIKEMRKLEKKYPELSFFAYEKDMKFEDFIRARR